VARRHHDAAGPEPEEGREASVGLPGEASLLPRPDEAMHPPADEAKDDSEDTVVNDEVRLRVHLTHCIYSLVFESQLLHKTVILML